MKRKEKRFRKRARAQARDGDAFGRKLRQINRLIGRGHHAAALTRINVLLSDASVDAVRRGRVLALAGDSEFRRGAYDQAARLYQQAAAQCVYAPLHWLRPCIGHVSALLKDVRIDEAISVARQTLMLAEQKKATFDLLVAGANEEVEAGGVVQTPRRIHRVSVVAGRLGQLFMREGEPLAAREFFERGIRDNPAGACRARQGLARIALAANEPREAARWAAESIRFGKFAAKTLGSWPLLITAQRRLGGWMISERLLAGLASAPPSVRARAVLTIVRELRNNDMRQWREVLHRWSSTEGADFPIIEAELRKLVLSSCKAQSGHDQQKFLAAQHLLNTPGLSPVEWLSGAKEAVRAGFALGEAVDVEALLGQGVSRFGAPSRFRMRHGIALSCAAAGQHDAARLLLQQNINQAEPSKPVWRKSVWALARLSGTLGQHEEAAHLYRQLAEAAGVPDRFRLQTQLLYFEELIASGQPQALLAARASLEPMLADVQDPVLLMDFARQIPGYTPELQEWRLSLLRSGVQLGMAGFAQMTHPGMAADILFKITRRQVHDFSLYQDALGFWESMSEQKKAWLWSTSTSYWEYLRWILVAYLRSEQSGKAADLASMCLEDPATPPEGRALVGVTWARWLVKHGQAEEAMHLFSQLVVESPSHPQVAHAWYWKALEAHKQGNRAERDRCCLCLRRAQGLAPGLMEEKELDAKALLLSAELDVSQVMAHNTRHEEAFAQAWRGDIVRQLGLLP